MLVEVTAAARCGIELKLIVAIPLEMLNKDPDNSCIKLSNENDGGAVIIFMNKKTLEGLSTNQLCEFSIESNTL